MGIVIWVVFGVLAGSVAKLLMPGPSAGGIRVAILVGVAGALIGGFLGTFSATGSSTAFDVRSLLMAVVGTLLLLFSYRSLAMRGDTDEGREYQS